MKVIYPVLGIFLGLMATNAFAGFDCKGSNANCKEGYVCEYVSQRNTGDNAPTHCVKAGPAIDKSAGNSADKSEDNSEDSSEEK